jgi:hypothetical protein
VTDFVGHWVSTVGNNYVLIELEKPSDRLFQKNGDPSAKLTHAIRQCKDWSAWISDNKAYIETIMPGVTRAPSVIIIGRQGNLSVSERRRLRELNDSLHNGPFITTFDSLLRANRSYGWGVEYEVHGLQELSALPDRRDRRLGRHWAEAEDGA